MSDAHDSRRVLLLLIVQETSNSKCEGQCRHRPQIGTQRQGRRDEQAIAFRGRDRRVRRRSSCLRLVRACAWVIVTLLPCVLAIHLLVLINGTDKSGCAVKSVTALRKLRFTSHEKSMLKCIGRPCRCSARCGDVGRCYDFGGSGARADYRRPANRPYTVITDE